MRTAPRVLWGWGLMALTLLLPATAQPPPALSLDFASLQAEVASCR